jgi:hypothetical protein
MKKALLALSFLLAPAACERASELGPCPEPYIPRSVSVTVQDSVTGANVTPGATLVLHGSTYVDSVVAQPGAAETSVGYGAGTFTLTVRQSGYLTWTKTGVKVEKRGECDAWTVRLTARLKPAA